MITNIYIFQNFFKWKNVQCHKPIVIRFSTFILLILGKQNFKKITCSFYIPVAHDEANTFSLSNFPFFKYFIFIPVAQVD